MHTAWGLCVKVPVRDQVLVIYRVLGVLASFTVKERGPLAVGGGPEVLDCHLHNYIWVEVMGRDICPHVCYGL